jgi:hypothetical protein
MERKLKGREWCAGDALSLADITHAIHIGFDMLRVPELFARIAMRTSPRCGGAWNPDRLCARRRRTVDVWFVFPLRAAWCGHLLVGRVRLTDRGLSRWRVGGKVYTRHVGRRCAADAAQRFGHTHAGNN